MKKYKITDKKVVFGEYPQTKVTEEALIKRLADVEKAGDVVRLDGKKYLFDSKDFYLFEPVEWIVLDVKDSVAYLIANRGLDCRVFDKKTEYFKDSEIRTWLNQEFLDRLTEEKEDLITSEDGDSVTLLTKEEQERFGPDNKKVTPTDYALRDATSEWERYYAEIYWLGTDSPYEFRVYTSTGWEFCHKQALAVVPTIRLAVDVPTVVPGPAFSDDREVIAPIDQGREVLFGRYPQSLVTDKEILNGLSDRPVDRDGFTNLNGRWYARYENKKEYGDVRFYAVEPIVWTVVEDDDKKILLSKYCLDHKPFVPLYYRDGKPLSDWLNEDFFALAFGNKGDLIENFRDRKVNSLSEDDIDEDNRWKDDWIAFFQNDDQRGTSATDFAKRQNPGYLYCSYWLATEYDEDRSAFTVDESGNIGSDWQDSENFVRPFIVLKA
ncbi:MAG: hypothetical protein IJ735_04335 [Clostridia bacterium]|nr:hypothetical protein [Clostridia bacterium]